MIAVSLFAIGYHQLNQRASRMRIANNMFIDQGIYANRELMKGIDFSKPVSIIVIPKDTTVIQYQVESAPQGNFYAMEGSLPNELGISDEGYDYETKKVVRKELRYYKTTTDVKVLCSYAAPVIDNWSTPEIETQRNGSNVQYFTTCKRPCFKLIGRTYNYETETETPRR